VQKGSLSPDSLLAEIRKKIAEAARP